MKEWEAKVVKIDMSKLNSSINQLGMDGWELVQMWLQPKSEDEMDEVRANYLYVVWFKREVIR